ncbi:hypothetical protein CONLIGDRAFT_714547 [Coniochaeta ligniaria NRRL 30616]|uniref:Uncharacterized protein n=1 Tax=Coniochaeta ligniaria NRRL 30616 TaxID=1408157 RepID=A0A1J7JLF3_9PEZI|nr:hypothetical protein CONLIGDRAFT_714547 [Coniochaeta ligniaria NRRL 30616]
MADEEAGTGDNRPAETPPADARTNAPTPIRDPSSPTKLLRPAPTFHAGKITITHGSVKIPSPGGLDLDLGVSWERTVQETRCVRCRKAKSVSPHFPRTGPELGAELGLPLSFTPAGTRDAPSSVPKDAVGYLVMGIISAVDRQPMRLETIRLRGPRYFFSLKSVKAFRLYRCVTSTAAHKQLELDSSAMSDLKQFRAAYKKRPWPPAAVNEGWARWVVDCLDGGSMDIMSEKAYSLEIVLGWSPSRISIAVLSPVALSLIIGFWFNSRDWTDLATIQTAWGVASYIATAGGLVAAMLGIISGLADT